MNNNDIDGGCAITSAIIVFSLILSLVFSGWTAFFIVLGIIVVLGISFIVYNNVTTESDKERMTRIYNEIEEQKKAVADEYDAKYGICTKAVSMDGFGDYRLRVYESAQIFVAYAMKDGWPKYIECKFSEVTSCELNGETFAPTVSEKIDNANIIGRAVVGAAVAGSVGAVIGGVTANKKRTEFLGGARNDVIIYLKNIENPVICISCGAWESKAIEIFATIKAILEIYGK